MQWLLLFSPRAGTFAGAAWIAWKWARSRVKDNLAYGSREVVNQAFNFCSINLLAACGRWALYILALLCFEFLDYIFGFNGVGGAVLAILLKYFIAASLGVINILTLFRAFRTQAFLHPIKCLRQYLLAKTTETLRERLEESLFRKMFFYITWHNVEEEAAKIVSSSFAAVVKVLVGTVCGYLLLLFLFGKLYEAILEACLGMEFSSMAEYYLWPFRQIFF